MDFLDPNKERRNRLALVLGYGLIGFAIVIASIVLLYQTDGYCVDSRGSVDRCGLVFVASQPSGSQVTIDDKVQQARTNTKFNVRSGTYQFKISQAGYHDWQRQVVVKGGDVQRFDYPLLIPTELRSSEFATHTSDLFVTTQSPDRRWLMTAEADDLATVFRLYDLRSTPEPASASLAVSADVVTATATGTTQKWEEVEWSTNNRHVLFLHTYHTVTDAATGTTAEAHEYVLIDRQNPGSSRNLTRELSLPAEERLSLFNKRPTLYYGYNSQTKILRSLALTGDPPFSTQLERVEAFKTDADDSILYVTDTPPSGATTEGKMSVVLQRGEQVRVIRQIPESSTGYLLDMAKYDGDWYVVLAGKDADGLYLYRNPIDQDLETPDAYPRPLRLLKLNQPQAVRFSATAQFILAQQGQQMLVYDIKNIQAYRYTLASALDAPQQQFEWLDGHRLVGVSGGKGFMTEYDNINTQTLVATDPAHGMFFSPDFRRVVTVQSQPNGGVKLFLTGLVVQES